MKALFVVNARSGKKRTYDIAELIRKHWPFPHDVLTCAEKSDLDAIMESAVRDAVDVLFAVGGDGTVHETAKRLIGGHLALGVVPTGSGNGFARHLGIPVDPGAALEACARGRIEIIDTAAVNDAPFVGVMGLGLDAVIAERFASSNVRGLETYVREGVGVFTSFTATDYTITADGETTSTRAFVVAAANSGQYGNNARIAPLASLQDGLLDVVIVGEASLLDSAFLLGRLFSGSFHRARGVTTLQTPELTIVRPEAGPAHLDGEPLVLPAALTVKIVARSLRVLVPDSARVI